MAENLQKMLEKIRETLKNNVNKRKMAKRICVCCFLSFGIRSQKVQLVTQPIEKLIQEFVWPEYSMEKTCCPKDICVSCRTNLYAINREKTEKLGKWIEIISQVLKKSIRMI